MRVQQHAYFLVRSDAVLSPDITAQLGIEPDKVRRRGSRTEGPPPVPRTNLWMVMSGRPDTVSLDEHFDSLFARLEPYEDKVRAFLASTDATGVIAVVRNFSAGCEDDDALKAHPPPEGMERLPDQHPLLGFHLDHQLIAFAARTHVDLDFDEYGPEYL
jgi:hypothetical protein